MKVLLLASLVLLLLYGCRAAVNTDPVLQHIPGTYFRFSKHEYGTEYDTLSIAELNRKAGQFRIIRRHKYERVIEGNLTEPEYRITMSTGFFNAEGMTLRENETGIIFSFDADMNLLFDGAITYRRL